MYPNKYFNLAQYRGLNDAFDPDGSPPYGYTRMQYGRATRGLGFMRVPAGTTAPPVGFATVAPFDFFTLIDNNGNQRTFEYRPGIAPPFNPTAVPSVAGRIVIPVQGQTAANVAAVTVAAIAAVSSVDGIGNPDIVRPNRLGIVARTHTTPSDQLTLCLVQPGTLLGQAIDNVTATGWIASGSLAFGTGNLISGRTPAVGFIQAVAGAQLVDTETFTLDDGINTPVVFEFSNNGPVIAPNVTVDFSGGPTADVMAQRIVAAINSVAAPPAGPGPNFAITARIAGAGPLAATVLLQNDFLGSVGGSFFNFLPIAETVANASFAVGGMIGGQDGSIMAPLRWGLSRAMGPTGLGFELPTGE